MSYILEALRRAQAERERGQVPGLGTQALPVSAPEPATPRWPGWTLAALTGLGLLALLALLATWTVLNRPAAALKPAEAVAPLPPVSPLAQVPPASSPVPALVVVSAPLPVPAAPPVPAPTPSPITAPMTALPAASSPAASPARPDDRGAVPLAQLSPEQRRDWPVFSLGGTVWSESPASRFVIANGQVVREGEAVVPGLVLERIAPKTLLLRWRGLQVLMPH